MMQKPLLRDKVHGRTLLTRILFFTSGLGLFTLPLHAQSSQQATRAAGEVKIKQSVTKPARKPTSSDRTQPTRGADVGKGVIAMFAEAQKLYNAGNYNEALILYDRIVKKYPSHEPSIIQYGKTLYRLDRIPESYNLFARINPQYLDPETSYEYGYASYVNQRWDAALFGFKRVPADNALYDLANYYGALSAVKLKKYAEAEDMLDKAVVLPDKLAKSRQLYQKHVQSLRHLQEKADLEQATNEEKARINGLKNKGNPAGAQPVKPVVADTPTTYVHEGFLTVDRLAKLKVSQEHQTIDNHGYNQTYYNNDVGTFVFLHGPMYPLPIKSFGKNRSAVGFQLDLEIEDRTTKGRLERLIAYENTRDIPRSQTTDLASKHLTTGTMVGSPWIEFAMPSGWWIGLTGLLRFDYPNFARGQRSSTRSGTPHLGRQFGVGPHKGSILGTYKYEQFTDSETQPLIDSGTSTFTGEVVFTSDTTVTTELTAIHYTYETTSTATTTTVVEGPDDIYSGKLTVKQAFPLGFVVKAYGSAAQQKGNLIRGIPTYDVATADGTTLLGGGNLVASPVSWLEFKAAYEAAKTTWQVDQADREDAFKKNVPDFVDQTTFTAGLKFAF